MGQFNIKNYKYFMTVQLFIGNHLVMLWELVSPQCLMPTQWSMGMVGMRGSPGEHGYGTPKV